MTVCVDDMVKNGRQDLPLKPDGTPISNNCMYEPEFCDLIVEEAKKKIMTPAMIAVACGVGKQTIAKWRKIFPEFDHAVDTALAYAESGLDKKALDNMEYVDSKGIAQFRSELWKEIKTEYKGVDKEIKEAVIEAADAALKVSEMVKKIRENEI